MKFRKLHKNRNMITASVIPRYIRARQVLSHIDFRRVRERLLNWSALTPKLSLRSFKSVRFWPRSTTFSIFAFMPSMTSFTWLFNLPIFESGFLRFRSSIPSSSSSLFNRAALNDNISINNQLSYYSFHKNRNISSYPFYFVQFTWSHFW